MNFGGKTFQFVLKLCCLLIEVFQNLLFFFVFFLISIAFELQLLLQRQYFILEELLLFLHGIRDAKAIFLYGLIDLILLTLNIFALLSFV